MNNPARHTSETHTSFFAMNLHPLLLLLIALLPACKPDPETPRLEMEKARAAYEQQAADMQRRSEDLQRQLTDLERAMRDQENAELRARLEAIEKENTKLMAEAAEARRKSQSLRDELASQPVPRATPYVPPAPIPAPVPRFEQPWSDPAADYSMFYDSLRPHGRWLEISGYGYAFRPSQADRTNWRPYVDGRWVWTDRGWTWSSQEPFGWACYHYGRWTRVSRHGWIWIPGREWAPAWVSWRHGQEVVGWAPLPPGASGGIGHDCDARYRLAPTSYTFISATDFGRSSYINCSLPTTRITTAFQQTVNVTNIVYVAQQSTCIQRGGPAIDWVEKQCRARVPRGTVRLANHPTPTGPRPDRSQPSFVAAPVPLAVKDGPRHTPVIAERIQQPVLLDGWKDVPKDQQAGLREIIERQSREPAPQLILADTPALPSPKQPTGPTPELSGNRPAPNAVNTPTISSDDGKAAELEHQLVARKEELARQQAEAETMQKKMLAEQEKREAESQKKQAAEMSAKEAAAAREKQEAEMIAQQQELARKQAEAEAMRQQIEEQEKQAAAMRAAQEAEAAKAAETAATQQREAQMRAEQEAAERQAMAEAQQREAAMRAQQEAEMRARQEEAERQRQMEMQRQQQEAAMRAQQEAEMRARQEEAERQRQMEMQRQQQEAAMRAQQEAEMRARQEEAERQRQMEMQRQQQEAAMRAQQEAEMRARQEEAERQRQMEMQRQQQEAAMRAQQEAAQRPPNPPPSLL
jgi:hypothetical protein